jgi:hypothetical protein
VVHTTAIDVGTWVLLENVSLKRASIGKARFKQSGSGIAQSQTDWTIETLDNNGIW